MSRNLPYKRTDRVASQIFEVISESFYTELVGESFLDVQLTRVEITPDLRSATVYYHLLNFSAERRKVVEAALNKLRVEMRNLIRSQIRMKYIPMIRICYDEGVDVSARVEELLRGGVPNE